MAMFSTIEGKLRAYTAVLIILPACAMLIAFYSFMRSSSIADTYAYIAEETDALHVSIERWLTHRIGDIAHVAKSPATVRGNQEELRNIAGLFLESHGDFSNLVFIDASGIVTIDPTGSSRVDVSDRAYFASARNGTSTITTIFNNRVSGSNIVIITCPIRDTEGTFLGVVAGAIRIDTIVQTFSLSFSTKDWSPFLLRNEDHMLLDSSKPDTIITPPAPTEQRTPRIYTNNDGVDVIGTSNLITAGDWLLVRETPLSEILGHMHKMLLTLMGTSLITLVVLTPFMLRFTASITRPVKAVTDMSTRMLTGEYDATCQRIDTRNMPTELARLYENFCNMAARTATYLEQLRVFTSTDMLTGLGNRRSLEEDGARILETCLRAGTDCACLVLDIDRFKSINDTYGHQTGDAALRKLGDVLRDCARKSDFLARMGGEEFAIIAANTSIAQAAHFAERVRSAVQRATVIHGNTRLSMTISIGIAGSGAGCTSGTTTLDEIIGRADRALYQAKNNGRNRVELWQPDPADAPEDCLPPTSPESPGTPESSEPSGTP